MLLLITKKRLETEIHMLLDVAVEQGEARLTRDQVDRNATVQRNDDGVFHNSASRLAVHIDELKRVPMHVKRMRIVCAIAEKNAVACAFLQHEFVVVRIRFAVDRVKVEAAGAAWDFFESHFDAVVRLWLTRPTAENRVIEERLLGRNKFRFAVLILVLDDNPQAAGARGIVDSTKDPHARLIHFDVCVDSFTGTQHENFGIFRRRHGIAVEREHMKHVAGQ